MDSKTKLAGAMIGTTFSWCLVLAPVNDGNGWRTVPIGYFWLLGLATLGFWAYAWKWVRQIELDARRNVYKEMGAHPSRRRPER
jgi:hypothetical protein